MPSKKPAGFTISERQRFPSFVYGYQSIYSADLPVYISADSILYAVHESYDELLKAVEYGSLIPTLTRLLTSMRGRLGSGRLIGRVGRLSCRRLFARAGERGGQGPRWTRCAPPGR